MSLVLASSDCTLVKSERDFVHFPNFLYVLPRYRYAYGSNLGDGIKSQFQ